MYVMHKGKNRTLSAKRWAKGISMGIYGGFSVASLDFADAEKEKIVLTIDKDICEEMGIEINIVDKMDEA